MPTRLFVAEGSLSPDPHERHSALRKYFCDIDARAEMNEGRWDLTLDWNASPERHVDPGLQNGLGIFGASLETMPFRRFRQGGVQFSLFDTWTLMSWSEWLVRQRARRGREVERAVILHIDDHKDFMAPRLFKSANGWVDPLTGAPVDVYDPPTICRAIESGAIGMGSFIAPFVHAVPETEIRHLGQRVVDEESEIVPTTSPDDLLEPGAPRPSLELRPWAGQDKPRRRYLATRDVDRWLDGLPPWPILVHIDMDYFSNRYNGDSDWEHTENRLDPSLDQVTARIEELCAKLSASPAAPRIADITVAFVPGFFPAEFWDCAYRTLRQRLEPLSDVLQEADAEA